MTFALDSSEYSDDIVDYLMSRVLKEHGGMGDEFLNHFNLTKTDSIMHLAAAEEIKMLRHAMSAERNRGVDS
jgi:hypothetical protein